MITEHLAFDSKLEKKCCKMETLMWKMMMIVSLVVSIVAIIIGIIAVASYFLSRYLVVSGNTVTMVEKKGLSLQCSQ